MYLSKQTMLMSSFLLASSVALAGWGIGNVRRAINGSARGLTDQLVMANPGKKVVYKLGEEVAKNPEFRSKADKNGWNLENCQTAGAGLATMIAGFKGAALCATYVAGEPLSTTGCVALIAASGATITHIACTQLCHDHHLRDC